ncbi:GNAT family N-acetyltransferase [Parablautia sp. Marseille-Q6255]|uniref:GNAT family N-acetyltransferase n=1 Tax=Parablautia sp. Marseille-Q6255 TaxID=3039593 RepID=UPI0024BC47BB|nr:GNAT family N-acetyltransferase [Parablautia sp. Marseille-Q6255]
MIFRRLSASENSLTRPLYESVFTEDDRQFVDYYYQWKVRDSRIYVAEDENGIHSMVHLNPFRVSVCKELHTLHYIVAVATQEAYRHRGLMRTLLTLAEQDMEKDGEPFTFLMPASEKIYAPFGYRYFAVQKRGWLRTAGGACVRQESQMVCRPARPQEYAALAAFVNDSLSGMYDVFIYRDAAYYERLCAEQRCQNGEVMVICRPDGKMIGTFCTSQETQETGGCELREVIVDPGHREEALGALAAFAEVFGDCKVCGYTAQLSLCGEEEVPLLMGKRPGGGIFCSEWKAEKIFINEVV